VGPSACMHDVGGNPEATTPSGVAPFAPVVEQVRRFCRVVVHVCTSTHSVSFSFALWLAVPLGQACTT
jgi:hypothetical protein